MNELQHLRDEWLALRCQAGEAHAFRALVTQFQSPLQYYASKVCGNVETAREVVQDAWIKASREIDGLQNPASIRAWLYRIVHGLAVDRVRRDIARERAEDAVLETSPAIVDDDLSFGTNAEAIHRLLDRLNPKHREVLVLFFLEDFSLAQIAQVVRCSEGTVKSRLHYAKAALRSLLEESHELTS